MPTNSTIWVLSFYATEGTAKIIEEFGMEVTIVDKIHENPKENILTLLESGTVDYVISTSAKGRLPTNDSVKLRRKSVEGYSVSHLLIQQMQLPTVF